MIKKEEIVRAKMMTEAMRLLKSGVQIEIHNKMLGDFMKYTERSENNFIHFNIRVNMVHVGYSVITPKI